jgi:tetratricopeptide (TPR) repeat protein
MLIKNSKSVAKVIYLGGINEIIGFIIDESTDDLILIGKYSASRPVVTIDDFAVALRARLVHNEWPTVSIDPPSISVAKGEDEQGQAQKPEAAATEIDQRPYIRFEGGIEDTEFGRDFLIADYQLKLLSMGLETKSLLGFSNEWEIGDFLRKNALAPQKISAFTRYWFYPVESQIAVREGAAILRRLNVQVLSEVLSVTFDGVSLEEPKQWSSMATRLFLDQVNDRFPELMQLYPSFARVQSLMEMVAAVYALEKMQKRPNLEFWLQDYKIATVSTPRTTPIVRRARRYLVPGRAISLEYVSKGGIQANALAIRVSAGDAIALRKAVLESRPYSASLTWQFAAGLNIQPIEAATLQVDDAERMLAEASYLESSRRFEDALALFASVAVSSAPDSLRAEGHIGAAKVLINMERYSSAREHASKAADLDPDDYRGPFFHGVARFFSGEVKESLEELNAVKRKWSDLPIVDYYRGLALVALGAFREGAASIREYVALNPKQPRAWLILGEALEQMGLHHDAILAYEHVVRLEPREAKIDWDPGVGNQAKERLKVLRRRLEENR